MPAGLPLSIQVVGPLSTDFVAWRYGGVLRVTLVAKATFSLEDGADARPVAAEKVQRGDRFWDDDPKKSLRVASEIAPYLPQAGVVLTGHACAVEPVASLTVQLAIFGEQPVLDKTFHVFGDVPRGGGVPTPFRRMDLRYERAYGGPEVPSNPVGVGFREVRPNLVHPTNPQRPCSFGPIAPQWPLRRRLFGATDPRAFADPTLLEIPDGFDFRAFSPAPPDQLLPAIVGDEWLVLHGLLADRPRLESRLPSVRVLGRARAPGREDEDVELVADTLVVDADRQVASVLWRGSVVVASVAEIAKLRAALALVLGEAEPAWPSLDVAAGPAEPFDPSSSTTAIRLPPGALPPPLPFEGRAPGEAAGGARPPPDLPPPRPPLPTIEDMPSEEPTNEQTQPVRAADVLAALPFGRGGPAAAPKPGQGPGAQPAGGPPVAAAFDIEDEGTNLVEEVPPSVALPFRAAAPGAAAPVLPEALPARPEVDDEPSGATQAIDIAALRAQATPFGAAPRAPTFGAPPLAPPTPPPAAPAAPLFGAPPAPVFGLPPPTPPPSEPKTAAGLAAPPPLFGRGPLPPAAPPPSPAPPLPAEPAAFSPPPLFGAPPFRPLPPTEQLPVVPELPSEPKAMADAAAELRRRVESRLAGGLSLDGEALGGANLEGLDLSDRSLVGADLRGARLARARLARARLDEADLSGADLTGADLTEASLDRAKLGGAMLERAVLAGASAAGVAGRGASLRGADVTKAKLAGADLTEACLVDAKGEGVDLGGARLVRADLSRADLRKARLAQAVLALAKLDLTDLRGASLEGANLHQTPRRKAKLAGAILTGLVDEPPEGLED